jgi:serine O-acetyltransferase
MFENLRADLQAAAGHRALERGWRVFIRRETKAILQYRFSHWVHTLRIPVVRQLLMIVALVWQRWNQIMLAGILIAPDAEIGPGLVLHTAYGLQISPTIIGSNCTFNSQVHIGTGVKSIGDNCYFAPGCKIIGEVKIGNNVLVVANSVVLTDVPDNTTIMGVPARIKLPGGRLRKMPWKTMDAKKKEAQVSATKTNSATKAQGSNGVNGAKTNGASAAVPKPNGAQPHGEPQTQPEPQQKINA